MHELSVITSSDNGLIRRHNIPLTTAEVLQAAGDGQDTATDDLLFGVLLPGTDAEADFASDAGVTPQQEDVVEAALPEVPEDSTAQLAQQFLSSLVAPELQVLLTPSVQEPAHVMLEKPGVTMAPVKDEAVDAGNVRLPSQPVAATAMPSQERQQADGVGSLVSPAMSESLRTATLHAMPAAPAPAPPLSAGQPHLQITAPLQIDGSGEALPAQLQQALGERLNMQINNHIQHATIRLDPPEMGRIEIVVQIEAGKIQVQIAAGQGDVYRALQQVSHELRQALTEQHFVEVDVQVSSRDPQQQPGRQPRQRGDNNAMILANEEPETAHDARSRNDDSILMTV